MRGARHPMQPIVWAKGGVIRFKENRIVRAVLDAASEGQRMDLNDIARADYSTEDREQFAQLIGYSVSGFGDLSYARKKTVAAADAIADEMIARRSRSSRRAR